MCRGRQICQGSFIDLDYIPMWKVILKLFKNIPESTEITETIEEELQICNLFTLLFDLAWIDSIIKANFF